MLYHICLLHIYIYTYICICSRSSQNHLPGLRKELYQVFAKTIFWHGLRKEASSARAGATVARAAIFMMCFANTRTMLFANTWNILIIYIYDILLIDNILKNFHAKKIHEIETSPAGTC